MHAPTGELTSVQLKTFRAIKKFLDEHGFPPTVGELADQLSRTKASTHANLDSLIQKGFIRRTVGKARSLEILRSPHTTVINMVAIPLLGDVPAGVPIAAEEQHVGEVHVEENLVGKEPCFALKVVGDSMIGADILDGDTLIVRQQPLATDRDVVVASIEGEVTVKRLSMVEGKMRLLPENKKYKPIDITHASDFRNPWQGDRHATCRCCDQAVFLMQRCNPERNLEKRETTRPQNA